MTGAPHELTFPKLGPGSYAVHMEGDETDLRILKGEGVRAWGAPQEWEVVLHDRNGGEDYLFTAKGLDDAKRVLRVMALQLRS